MLFRSAKLKHAITLMDEKGQILKAAFTITNNRSGFDQLHKELQTVGGIITVGLEATGHYWLSLYDDLTRNHYPVIVLNPLQVAAYRKSGIRKVKRDASDAFWIADYIRVANLPPTEQNLPIFLQLRELSRFRFRLTEQVGDLKRKLLTILDRVFPEYEHLFSSVFLQASRAILQEAVSAQEFADFDLQELANVLAEASRGRFGLEKAEALRSQARQSVGIGFLTDAVHLEMRCILAQLELLDAQRGEIDQTIADLMQQIPQHITSIPGIGPVTGAAILSEIGDIQRFESADKLVAYAGIDATVYQTGQFEASEAHMSKRGSPYLRHALWCAATAAILHDPSLKSYYQKKRDEGKHHGTALGAVCRKLLGRIFVVLKEQRAYVIR